MPRVDLQDRFIANKGIDEGDSSDGEGTVKPLKRSGRRKIKIEYIEDKNRRHITFSKRKSGIMKKAYELSTLTGTQVLLLVVSETGLVYTFTTVKLQPIVTNAEGKNLIQACLNTPDPEQEEEAEAPRSQSVASTEQRPQPESLRIKNTEPAPRETTAYSNYDNRPYHPPYPPANPMNPPLPPPSSTSAIPPINANAYGYVNYPKPHIQKPTPQPPPPSAYPPPPPAANYYANSQYPGYWSGNNEQVSPLKQDKKN
ncbi:hypothetical protein BY458DRAFT_432185 [Sporodiniella umbellata]|nr:hypothetical protein BY458DRAFT_432185 [Sporodiniella umbellata]